MQIYTSKLHGYEVIPYTVVTDDQQTLVVHRLVHPSDFATKGPLPRKKKPYLLVHGLLATSASFIAGVAPDYRAPLGTVDIWSKINANFRSPLKSSFEHDWASTADRRRKEHANFKIDKWHPHAAGRFARKYEPDYDGDPSNFARVYRQAYKKFELNLEDLSNVTGSLAMSLANFGNDVWLVNLRGNKYSPTDKWDFKLEAIAQRDLPAVIRFIQDKVECKDPIGLVSYSYGAAFVLRMLAAIPGFSKFVEPVVMVAPTLMSATKREVHGAKKTLVKILARALISANGPFPSHSHDKGLEGLICQLPLAGKLCRVTEHLVQAGSRKVVSVNGLVLKDRQDLLSGRDMDCGRTSKALLHQLIKNYVSNEPLTYFRPVTQVLRNNAKEDPYRRSVILVHSDEDEVSGLAEVKRIRDTILKTLTLIDYSITRPAFRHEDFLFSQRNQYLVNAEIVRMVQIYDYLMYRKNANEPTEPIKVH